MRFESQTLNGIRLGWRMWGSTENYPLLCLHGAWGQSEFWAPFANSISEHRCVVALDLRGHGESGWSEDYSLDAFSADVAALRAYYGWETFDLVGLSLGGLVSISYAGQEAEHLTRLTIVDVAPTLSPAITAELQNSESYPPSFESLDAALQWARGDGLWGDSEGLRDDLALRLREQPDGSWAWRADPSFWESRQRSRWADKNDLWDALAQPSCPVQLVQGSESPFLDDDIVARVRERQPNLRHDVIQGSGHSVPRDVPDAFNRVVADFLLRG